LPLTERSAEALMAGLFNDVPTIIGTNEQEIDFAPAAHLENYTIPEFQDYIRKRYARKPSTFGHHTPLA
jgi:hypothetical protein